MLALLVVLAGCFEGDGLVASSPTDTTDGTQDEEDTDGSAVGADVTYYRDVQPILQQHCTRCHNEDGIGTGDYTDVDVVVAFAEIMLASIEDGSMPPPAADPECRDYQGSERMHLPDSSRDVIAAWVEGGAQLGDEAEQQTYDEVRPELTDPNLVIELPETYVPGFSSPDDPGNEYRCFVLDHGQQDDFYVTAMSPVIDNDALVHHIVLYATPGSNITDEMRDPSGYDCIDQTEDLLNGMVAGWAPGALPVELSEGHGIEVQDSDVLVMQMHYYYSSEESTAEGDRSGYAFRIDDDVDTEVYLYPGGVYDFDIPAGDPAYTRSSSWTIPDYVDLNIHGVFPHMHVLGTGYSMSAGDECIVESDTYDFDNQLFYMFDEPVPVEGGTKLSFECTWDNSADNPNQIHDTPVDVGYGERTDEEMCFFFTLMSFD